MGLETGNLPYWWFRPRDWVTPGRRLYLSIGVWAENDRPYFYVALGTGQKKFGRQLEIWPKFRNLYQGSGWKSYDDATTGEHEWYKSFTVSTGSIDKIAQEQIKNVRSVDKEIRKLVKLVEEKL